MQKDFGFIFLILLSLVSGCKKDNNRIATPTYELDSVEAGYFDTLGNYIHLKTIVIEPNFILNQIPEGFMYTIKFLTIVMLLMENLTHHIKNNYHPLIPMHPVIFPDNTLIIIPMAI